MLLTVLAIAILILWLTGFFGQPVIPEVVLPVLTISWSDPVMHAVVVLIVVVVLVMLLR